MCDLLGSECLKLLNDGCEGLGGALFRLMITVVWLVGLIVIKVIRERLNSGRVVAKLLGFLFCSFETGSLHG